MITVFLLGFSRDLGESEKKKTLKSKLQIISYIWTLTLSFSCFELKEEEVLNMGVKTVEIALEE